MPRGFWTGSTLFEELGFYYVGPVDGHNLEHLLPVLKNVRDTHHGPILIHAVTQKGKGYAPAEGAKDKYHGVAKFDVVTGKQSKPKANAPSYTNVFATSLIKEAQTDDKVVAITAAMPDGTGLDLFGEAYPKRTFDVGIAEQHAVTFAAGLATEGFKPFCAIYSTFLQRAYDQVVHDVAIQGLPVRFPIDRAGLVGADGPTHAGAFDTAFLTCLPGFVVMAASDEVELRHMVATAVAYDEGPISFRYPRGEGVGLEMPERGSVLEIGKGVIRREGTKVALLNFGGRMSECLKAADELDAAGLSTTVADARFAKPLDMDMIRRLAREHESSRDDRRRFRRWFRQPCADPACRGRLAGQRTEGAGPCLAGCLSRPRQAGPDVCPGRPHLRRHPEDRLHRTRNGLRQRAATRLTGLQATGSSTRHAAMDKVDWGAGFKPD